MALGSGNSSFMYVSRGGVIVEAKDEDLAIERVDAHQDSKVLKKVMDEVRTILTRNERVLYITCQGLTAVGQVKDAAIATDNRVIFYRRHRFGRMSFDDFLWEDVKNVTIREGVFSSTLICELTNGQEYSVGGLKKKQTRTFYSVSQQKELEWRERRRVRRIEEERARAGGTQITMPGAGESEDDGIVDPVERLAKVKEMFDQELISEAEYETVKANILRKMV